MADRKQLLLPRLNLEILQSETLLFLVEDSSTDGFTLDLITKYFLTTESLIRKIFQHPNAWEATLNYVRMFGDYAQEPWFASKRKALDTEAVQEPDFVNLFQQVQQMKVSEKIQLALKGNKEARALLLKDSNKQVILAVLNSPRLTEQEVESIAQSKNVSEDILRVVANNRNWMKNYGIIVGLVNNPKTPVGLSLGFIKNLKPKELNNLAKNKGVPEVIRSSAGKFLQMKRAGK
ncbi:MAG: hypothetical protein MCM46_17180 [Candidatus Manganitrophus sp. SB1]|nr:hypothetical protein [Candidatus Manganitrophus morganii]